MVVKQLSTSCCQAGVQTAATKTSWDRRQGGWRPRQQQGVPLTPQNRVGGVALDALHHSLWRQPASCSDLRGRQLWGSGYLVLAAACSATYITYGRANKHLQQLATSAHLKQMGSFEMSLTSTHDSR